MSTTQAVIHEKYTEVLLTTNERQGVVSSNFVEAAVNSDTRTAVVNAIYIEIMIQQPTGGSKGGGGLKNPGVKGAKGVGSISDLIYINEVSGGDLINTTGTSRKEILTTTPESIEDLLFGEPYTYNGVIIESHADNVANIWVGKNTMTADTDDLTDGYPLIPSDNIFIPIRSLTEFYVMAESGTAKVWFYIF